MERVKKLTEEIVLISFYAGFLLASLFFAVRGEDLSTKMLAFAFAIFFGKSMAVLFCRTTGILVGYQASRLSYKITVFLFIPTFAVAVLIKCLL